MNGWLHKVILAGLLGLAPAGGLASEPCATCGEKNPETFFWLTNAALPARQLVCAACTQLPTRCFICELPVKQDFLKLEDGRFLCARHARDAVLTPDDAQTVFTDAKREIMRLLRGCGSAPDRNITLVLVPSLSELEKLKQSTRSGKGQSSLAGLTRTRLADGNYQHTVYLLGGQPRARFLAVSAHEYTHTWMRENVPADRSLEATNAEAFCELTAYRVMCDLRENTEKNVILGNRYTGDALATFVKAEESYGFYRVVQWVLRGLQPRLDPNDLTSVLALKQEEARLPAYPQAVRTAVPDTLQLKGISGRTGHRLALINNQTLQAGETARVRVGPTSVMVRCIAVTDKSATIELTESGERQELVLDTR